MRFHTLATAALVTATTASPSSFKPHVRRATTASERLGLTWLGENGTLPKILYAALPFYHRYSLADMQ